MLDMVQYFFYILGMGRNILYAHLCIIMIGLETIIKTYRDGPLNLEFYISFIIIAPPLSNMTMFLKSLKICQTKQGQAYSIHSVRI